MARCGKRSPSTQSCPPPGTSVYTYGMSLFGKVYPLPNISVCGLWRRIRRVYSFGCTCYQSPVSALREWRQCSARLVPLQHCNVLLTPRSLVPSACVPIRNLRRPMNIYVARHILCSRRHSS